MADHVGFFVASVQCSPEQQLLLLGSPPDDGQRILLQATTDRLVEAASEYLHCRIRREWWRYAAEESLTSEQMQRGRYSGIRPAPGYPSQPDHTEKATLWNVGDVERLTNVKLTETFALSRSSSTCGLLIAQKESKYFAVGRVASDQVADYAARKGWTVSDAERWLSSVFEP